MRYATWAILGDYFRAVGGFGVALMLLIVLPPNPWLLGLFGLVCALFVWFFYQTLLRHCSQVDIHEEGLAVTGLINRRIAWDDLSALSLRYYGTAREIKKGEGGHMQLRLTGRNGNGDGRTRIGTGPAFSSKTICNSSSIDPSSPMLANVNAVPILG